MTDTCGFLLFLVVHAADIQGRNGTVDVLTASCMELTLTLNKNKYYPFNL